MYIINLLRLANGAFKKLSTDPEDAANNKANLQGTKFLGSSMDGPGTISSYPPNPSTVTLTSVTWSAIKKWWEVVVPSIETNGIFVTTNSQLCSSATTTSFTSYLNSTTNQ